MPRIDAERILIVLHGAIGDVTRALPLAGLLRAGYPKAHLAWAVEPPSAPLLRGNPYLDEVIIFDRRRWHRETGAFLRAVRRRRFDLVLDLQRHLKSGIVSRASGARWRLGFHRAETKEGNWLFNNLHVERFGNRISKLDHYLKFIEFLGLPIAPLRWDFVLDSAEQAAVTGHLCKVSGTFATLFVGTRWQSKNWFPEQIAACADYLHRQYDLETVLLGGAGDLAAAQAALGTARTKPIDLVGKTSLREAIGIIARARLAIGPDTGLMHIAAALKVPVISLWGATEPLRTGPYGFEHLAIRGQAPCSPCNRRQCAIGRLCMQSITMEQIETKLQVVLSASHRASAVENAKFG